MWPLGASNHPLQVVFFIIRTLNTGTVLRSNNNKKKASKGNSKKFP